MFFGKQNSGMRWGANRKAVVFLPLVIAIMIGLTACFAAKGSIIILENPNGTGFTMELKEFSARNKCELSLKKGDELQIEISREEGKIALTISGKNGSEPYTGKDLQSGIFTVAVSERDEYVFAITGDKATGKVAVKNLGSRQSK